MKTSILPLLLLTGCASLMEQPNEVKKAEALEEWRNQNPVVMPDKVSPDFVRAFKKLTDISDATSLPEIDIAERAAKSASQSLKGTSMESTMPLLEKARPRMVAVAEKRIKLEETETRQRLYGGPLSQERINNLQQRSNLCEEVVAIQKQVLREIHALETSGTTIPP